MTVNEMIRIMIRTYNIQVIGDNIKVEMFASSNKAAHCEFIKAHKAEIIEVIKADEAEKAEYAAKLDGAYKIINKDSPELARCKKIYDTCAHDIARGKDIDIAIKQARIQFLNYLDSKC